tara:strand:- start:3548 stop:3970 length:423 start_codon:yes stop_codon:yes gene_type:complete
MAIKVMRLKEIALEDDYTHPVVSSGTGPVSLMTIDGYGYSYYDDANVTITTDGDNASKYGVKVMDATDSDDLAILKKLRETPALLIERSKVQGAFDDTYSKVEVYDALFNDVEAVKTAHNTLKSDINAIYTTKGLPALIS